VGQQAQELDRWLVVIVEEEEREFGCGKGEMIEGVSCLVLDVASIDPCCLLTFWMICSRFGGCFVGRNRNRNGNTLNQSKDLGINCRRTKRCYDVTLDVADVRRRN
jgi:hypothetical protein